MKNSKDVHVIGIPYTESGGLTLLSSLETLLKGICKLFNFAASDWKGKQKISVKKNIIR